MMTSDDSKVFHKSPKGREREIARNAVDYGDGTVMIQYLDNDDVAIVPKDEIINVIQGKAEIPQFKRNHAAIHEALPGQCVTCDEVREGGKA
jgi:hypothetical protein